MQQNEAQNQPVNQQADPSQMTPEQQEQMAINAQAMQQIQAIDQETRAMKQEGLNKSHDTEFSAFSDVNGQNPNQGNLNIIGEAEVKEAFATLMKYKENKAELEQKLADNEAFWKMQHWDVMYRQNQAAADKRIKPKSAWLVNTILNKHADAMDNYPEANILPRAKDDEETAKILSEIIPVILEQNDYENTYSDVQWYKNKNGTGVTGVFWNNDKQNGLGDIEIKKIDIMNLYWKSGINNIQDSPNVFQVTMMDNDEIKARYPELQEPQSGMPITESNLYHYGENVDTSNQSPVIDWYYKRRIRGVDDRGIPQMQTVLHYCKFCNGQVIYASENDPNYTERGWYDHGKYPFVFDTLFPIESNICGMGYVDLCADDQLYIDKLQQAILENAIANARPRYAVRTDSGLNEEEFNDLSNATIHFEGNLGEDAFRQITASPLNNIYETVYLQKIQEMKDTSGNTAASQGQTSNVTTASGIASLQEAAGKLSRDSSQESYRAYKEIIYLVIELIRQFYTEPRCFRIIGEMGQNEFVDFDNRKLQPQSQGYLPDGMGGAIDLGSRLPIMDIEVRPQKKSAYSKETQNQTALNLYNMGFFAPANADASLACLNMMDFDGVEKMRETVSQNGTLFQMVQALQAQLMQLSTIVDAQNGTNLTGELTGQASATQASASNTPSKGSVETSKGSLSSQAANATRQSTAPRS